MKILKSKNRMVDESLLQISPAYQRTIRASMVKKITSAFDQDAFGSLCVGERKDGSMWVVDGMQRLTAARKLDVQNIPCDIFQSEGPAHEARIFRHMNKDRVGVNSRTLFKALICEGDPQSVAILACVESCGFQVMLSDTSANRWPQLACIKSLQNVFERGGVEHLRQVLSVINDAWHGEMDATRGMVIDGLSLFLRGGEFDIKRLTKKLKAIDPMAVCRFADSQNKLLGGGRAAAMATAFLNYYNKGSRKKKAIDSPPPVV